MKRQDENQDSWSAIVYSVTSIIENVITVVLNPGVNVTLTDEM